MSDYTKQVAWSGKDALSDTDANKVISGDDFATEFSAVQTAVNSKIDDGGVTTSDIGDDAVTLSKMAHGTDGEIITYDTTGAPTTVAVGTSGRYSRVTVQVLLRACRMAVASHHQLSWTKAHYSVEIQLILYTFQIWVV